jgi:hypothetical protein
MLDGSLFVLLGYQPASHNGNGNGNAHRPLVLTRVDHQPTVQYVACFASDDARRRDDAESRELAEVLGVFACPSIVEKK